jgi:hypothetical protein
MERRDGFERGAFLLGGNEFARQFGDYVFLGRYSVGLRLPVQESICVTCRYLEISL